MKVCTKCGIEKSSTEFFHDKYTKDGYCCHCKLCRKAYMQAHRKEASLAVMKYHKTEKGKLNHRTLQAKYKKSDKGKLTEKRFSKTQRCKDLWKKNTYKRRRNLGFNKLVENDWNEPINWHHVNNDDVVPLPAYLHQMCYTGETKKHRLLCNKLVSILYPELKIEGD